MTVQPEAWPAPGAERQSPFRRRRLALYTKWDAVMRWICPGGNATHPFAAGHVWRASGTLANDRIEGADNGLGARQWRLERPQ